MQAFACQYWSFSNGDCYFKYSPYGKTNSNGTTSGSCNKPNPIPSNVHFALGCGSVPCPNHDFFADAITAAESAEAIVIVLGLNEHLEEEAHDRTDLDLPGTKN